MQEANLAFTLEDANDLSRCKANASTPNSGVGNVVTYFQWLSESIPHYMLTTEATTLRRDERFRSNE